MWIEIFNFLYQFLKWKLSRENKFDVSGYYIYWIELSHNWKINFSRQDAMILETLKMNKGKIIQVNKIIANLFACSIISARNYLNLINKEKA